MISQKSEFQIQKSNSKSNELIQMRQKGSILFTFKFEILKIWKNHDGKEKGTKMQNMKRRKNSISKYCKNWQFQSLTHKSKLVKHNQNSTTIIFTSFARNKKKLSLIQSVFILSVSENR